MEKQEYRNRKWKELSEVERLNIIAAFFGTKSSVLRNEKGIFKTFKEKSEQEVKIIFGEVRQYILSGQYTTAIEILGLKSREERDTAADKKKNPKLFDISEADLAAAKIAAQEIIFNAKNFDSLPDMADEGHERTAVEAAIKSKNFIQDLTADKITVVPAEKGKYYGPGILHVDERNAVLCLSRSLAVVYRSKDVAGRFPLGTKTDIKVMAVTERGVDAFEKHREDEGRSRYDEAVGRKGN